MPARPAMTPAPSKARPEPVGSPAGRRVVIAGILGPPMVVFLGLGSMMVNIVQLIALLVGGALVLLFAQVPGVTLRLFAAILPVQLLASAIIYAAVGNGTLVTLLGLWKEAAFLGVVAAAVAALQRSDERLDALDRLCLAFITLCTAYLLAPASVLGAFGGAVSLDVRITSWRVTALPVVLFVGARHLPAGAADLRRLTRWVVRWGAVFGALAVVEVVASSFWRWLLVDVVGINRYRLGVLGLRDVAYTLGVDEIRGFTAQGLPRIGGVLLSPLTLSFVLLVAFAFLVEHVVRGEGTPGIRIALALVVFGIVGTQTRSTILGLVLTAMVAVRPVAGRSETARARFAAVVVLGVLALVPVLLAVGIGGRFLGSDVSSDEVHSVAAGIATSIVLEHPFGQGLGMGLSGVDAGVVGAFVAENQFLDVGLQVGVLGLVLFAFVYLGIVRRLGKAVASATDPDVQLTGSAVRNALIGLTIPCLLLQPLAEAPVAWVIFVAAGAALGVAERTRQPASGPGLVRLR